jgi:hypothetical protein
MAARGRGGGVLGGGGGGGGGGPWKSYIQSTRIEVLSDTISFLGEGSILHLCHEIWEYLC